MPRFTFIACVTLNALLLFAAESDSSNGWQNRDFKQWTEKDARAIVSDSPWAKPLPLPGSLRSGVMTVESNGAGEGPSSASLGNINTNQNGQTNTAASAAVTGGTNAANNIGSGATPTQNISATPSGLGRNNGAPSLYPPVTVLWASAVPVRLAQLRLRFKTAEPTDTETAAATRPRDHYTIAVMGLPVPDDGVDAAQLIRAATLQAKQGGALHPTKADIRKFGDMNVYVFLFPKDDVIGHATGGTVEFRLNLMRTIIKKDFDLGTMIYQGKLAL